jgi:drug/metabolite transporter (DMT)-like permease
MIAILGGLGAAVCWSIATLCTSRSSRMLGAGPVLAWVMATGFAVLLPVAAFTGLPHTTPSQTAWLGSAGAANVAGLLLVYAALRIGKIGIVAAVASTEGAVTAVIAALRGESLTGTTMAVLLLIAAGIFLAALASDGGPDDEHERRAALMAAGAALLFGFGLYATGRISADVAVVWAAFPSRIVGVAAVALPLAARKKLPLTRAAAPLVAAAGLCEVLGFVSYTFGARHGIAVTAVVASQFAALSAIAAYALFRERLARLQIAGVTVIVVGVGVLAALRV